MSDFYADLERQLVDAGRRRAVAGPVRRVTAGRGRMLLALAGAVLVLVAGGALVPSLLRSGAGDGASDPGQPAAPTPSVTRTDASPSTPTATDLRGIAVSVLNGTTRTGLGRHFGDVLEARGATLTVIATSPDQAVGTTVVYYRDGSLRQARRVVATLGIGRTAPVARQIAVPSTDARVIVVLGADALSP